MPVRSVNRLTTDSGKYSDQMNTFSSGPDACVVADELAAVPESFLHPANTMIVVIASNAVNQRRMGEVSFARSNERRIVLAGSPRRGERRRSTALKRGTPEDPHPGPLPGYRAREEEITAPSLNGAFAAA